MRSCDGCAACCHALHIQELSVPTFQDCPHQCEAGCSEYQARPGACRDYQCLWLQGHLGENDRPDRLGVIFTSTVHPRLGKMPMLIEVRPGSLEQPRVQAAIDQMTTARPVVLSMRSGRLVIGPQGEIESYPANTPSISLTVGGQVMAGAR